MKLKHAFYLLIIQYSFAFSQDNAKKWFMGAETGLNIVQSDYVNDNQPVSVQLGILSEYYLNNNFAIVGKLKYYQAKVNHTVTETSYNSSSLFNSSYTFNNVSYSGNILTIPIGLKYEFRISKTLRGAVKICPSLNYEISSQYDYPVGTKTDYNHFFVGLNPGAGLNYCVSESSILFVEAEPNFGASRGKTTGLDFNNQSQTHTYRIENIFINIGVKFKIK